MKEVVADKSLQEASTSSLWVFIAKDGGCEQIMVTCDMKA